MVRSPSSRIGRVLSVLIVFALVAAACSDGGGENSESTVPPVPGGILPVPQTGTVEGALAVSLSTGELAEVVAEPMSVVEGEPLSEAAIAEIIDALPEWIGGSAAESDFNRPPDSLTPPLTGATIDVPFPGDSNLAPPTVETGPLEVVRFQPDGEVPVAPYLSVTFNQAMVPLTTLGQLAAEEVPVIMTPELPGRWEWIGTRTLRFEHESALIDRLPMATKFTVEIPAGTTSESGEELAERMVWQFETPSVQVEQFVPQLDSLPLEPVFVATFDQRIDPQAVLDASELRSNGDPREVRLATDAEIAADETVSSVVEGALDGRWMAFRAVEAFAPDSELQISIGPNVPSAEGLEITDDVRRFEARTYAALQVEDESCNDFVNGCQPGEELTTWFNNPLDLESLDPSLVTVSPALDFMSVRAANENAITVSGQTRGQTTYTVTFPASLTDVYGQTLGEEVSVDFEVREADPLLRPLEGGLITLDPLAERPVLPVQLINHDELRVRAYVVDPATDWAGFSLYSEAYLYGESNPQDPPWPVAMDVTISTGAVADELTEIPVDLSDALDGAPGHLVVLVEPTGELAELSQDDELYWQNRPTLAWVQSTSIGVDAFVDYDEVVVWTTDLRTGEPLEGVQITTPSGSTGTSGSDGRVTIQLDSAPDARSDLVARLGSDAALLSTGYLSPQTQTNQALFYVFDDRGLYRPGETVQVKGWLRLLQSDVLQLDLFDQATLNYTVSDAFGNEVAADVADIDALGGFDVSFVLPAGINLGQASVVFSAAGHSYTHSFGVQEFRRPEFEVSTEMNSPGPWFVDAPATAVVSATYFAGGALPDSAVEWLVQTRTATYQPPNWTDFTFGIWEPWWIEDFGYPNTSFSYEAEYFASDIGPGGPYDEPISTETLFARTDGSGRHALQMDFEGDGEGLPTTVSAEATVYDVNRQAWTSTTDLLVHPADLYVGLRSTDTFVEPGEELVVEGIVTDLDGVAVAGRALTMTSSRLEWQYVDGEWQEVAVSAETCETVSTEEAVECRFPTSGGGEYRISVDVFDDAGRFSHTEMTRWVSGGRSIPTRGVEQEEIGLVPNSEEYAPGDVAQILVEAPFSPAFGLVTVSRGGILSTETFRVDNYSAVIDVPIADEHIPNLDIQVDLVGVVPRITDAGVELAELPDRPAFATGRIQLPVPPTSRTLSVTATPAAGELAPGSETSVDIQVDDASGTPVEGAELAVVVVDEAVLALSGYELLDPLGVFYQPHYPEVWSTYGRESVVLVDPAALWEQLGLTADDFDAAQRSAFDEGSAETTAPGDVAAGPPTTLWLLDGAESDALGADIEESAYSLGPAEGRDGDSSIEVRTNFDALAVFEPDVVTGADGSATVDVTLPDNLTRYRVMVVAVDGVDQFGMGESSITARLPLMVRPSAPRFLNFGDSFELPVVVQNQTDEPMTVDVVLETGNLEITDGAGRRVEVPANDRIEVRFPVATAAVGTAGYRVAVSGGSFSDAAVGTIPVYTPATSEAFATYGVVDDGAVFQPLTVPEGVLPQFGGLEIGTSSTALQALTDAVLYINEYDYDSSDAYASRIMTVAALRDVLDAFDAEGLPDAATLEAGVAADISGLVALQHFDGGFRGWSTGQESIPFNSIQSVHALVLARDEGYSVPSGPLQEGIYYLQNIANYFPADYPQSVRDSLTAYALHVRALSGERSPGEAAALYVRAVDTLQLDAMAWLLPVLDDEVIRTEILTSFANRATETAGAATFATEYGEDAYLILDSDRRTDGIILNALITEDPTSDLLPKVVAGLLGNQTRGRWDNIQENTYILLAMNRYFDTFEAVAPDFVARIWLGDLYAGEHAYSGFSTDRGRTTVPMADVIAAGSGNIVVSKDGSGRLYYRLGLRYAPADFDLDPLDRGFVVQRTYEAVDDPQDVSQDEDGTWHIAAGAEVRVRLTMVADSRRTHAILIDPLAAGVEALNPDLAVVGSVPPIDPEFPDDYHEDSEGDVVPSDGIGFGDSWWWGHWWEHQNLRDDRAEAYTSLLSAGTYEFSYVARATTPGRYIVPPARAEEIYQPDVFGRSGTDQLVVE